MAPDSFYDEVFPVIRAYFMTRVSSDHDPFFDDVSKTNAFKTLKRVGDDLTLGYGSVFKNYTHPRLDERVCIENFIRTGFENHPFRWCRFVSVCAALWTAAQTKQDVEAFARELTLYTSRHFSKEFKRLDGWTGFEQFFFEPLHFVSFTLKHPVRWMILAAAGGLAFRWLYLALFSIGM